MAYIDSELNLNVKSNKEEIKEITRVLNEVKNDFVMK